ncbi:calcium/sodium antiporter [Halomonas sp. PAMB 3264]|nr:MULTISPECIES: calcium/sodium antiporter [unclassified Halomonas]UYG01633.1 calcium/sodium antiporter [Halomonas sp. GD1P12]WNL40652.1 calcium/sodium antiporter [Halomonas sp. PAMB 3232]WNL43975.1 calcium/sodium antiporter [Halomonas sp. PAMB 3264]
MLYFVLSLLGGIALLTLGGEALVRSAVAGAERLGVSALFTGLVIVGFGTSAPELVVSINAALDQQPDIAIGNVVGSNIGNIMLILGLCALIYPLTTKRQALKRDGLVMLAATLLFIVLGASGELGRLDALLFLAGLVGYLVWAYLSERQTAPTQEPPNVLPEPPAQKPTSTLWIVLGLLGGLALLIGGSQFLLYGAVGIAQTLGLSEAVIGLTIVAVGTSLPELAVSLVAALRRHADVAVGNILGSNIFNLLGILGVSAFLQPLVLIERMVIFDQWVMLGSAVALLVFLYTGLRLSRTEGGILLVGYAGFVAASFTLFG